MDESLTIQISQSTHEIVRELAEQSDLTVAEIVQRAIEDYRDKRFWTDVQSSFAALKGDPEAWADYQQERESWNTTLADGMEDRADEPGDASEPR